MLRTARKRFSNAHLTLALPDPFVQLYLGNRTVDRVLPLTGDFGQLRKLAKEHDLWFPLEGYENKHLSDNDGRMAKSRIEIWCETVGEPVADLCPHWTPRDSERQAVRDKLKAHGVEPGRFIVLQWASKNSSKDYTYNQGLVELLLAAGHKVLMVHSGAMPDIPGAIEVQNVPLRELGVIVEQAGLLFGPDSGGIHLAAATGTPSIAICSVTDGRVYFRDYDKCLVLQNTNTEGKPCEGHAPCWAIPQYFWCGRRVRGAGWCMEIWPPEQLLGIIETRLKEYGSYNQERLNGPQQAP